jgi:predicted ATPase
LTLGSFALRIDDRDAEAPATQKARALLAYLVMHRDADVARERLLELFWPDADPERARHNLKTATWSIRRIIRLLDADPDDYLRADRASMRWIAATTNDAQEFLESAGDGDAASRERAFTLYRGPFLEGDYDDWPVAQRERVESAYEELLARSLETSRDPERARRLLDRNPYDEDAYALLIDAELEAGRPLAARALAQRARAALRELGANAAEEFETRYGSILRAEFAAPSPVTTANNLPHSLGPIVGREREIYDVEALLREAHVVSIVGAGGIGKTRVALEVAANLNQRTDDGIGDGAWFVDLAPISDAALVPSTVAGAIGIELPPTQDPAVALVAMLKPLRLLLVLDNCEHVIDAAARLAEQLALSCPHVRIVATSREPLGFRGETVYRLDTLDDATAEKLFVARAQQANHRFVLAEGDGPVVREICRRLDGIALAIELAAARAHAVALDELLSRLDERFALLTRGNRTALPRQQTLRALIDWSYDLLSEPERTVFCRLGVFAAGFTLDAAARVCNDATATMPWHVADRLFALLEKSMVAATYAGAHRYRMLESMREYALERLRASSEEEHVRRAHAEYFAELSGALHESFGTGSEEEWVAAFERDLDNFRTALDWAVRADAALAGRIVGNLRDCWRYLNLDFEGLERSEAVLAALGERAGEPGALGVWLAVTRQSRRTGAYRRGIETGERALALAASIGDESAAAEAREIAGALRFVLGTDFERALHEMEQAATFLRSGGNPVRAAIAGLSYATLLVRKDPAQARTLLEEQLATLRSRGWVRPALAGEADLADIEFNAGEIERAIERARRVIEILRDRKERFVLALTLLNLSAYLGAAGEYAHAQSAAREAIVLGLTHEAEHVVAAAGQVLALVHAAGGDLRRAATLLGYVDAFYDRLGGQREPTEVTVQQRLLQVLGAGPGGPALATASAAGRKLSMEAACALALGNGPAFDPALTERP